MKRMLPLLLLLPMFASAQTIPPKANTITVKNVSFEKVCNALLDAGYFIQRKDSELKTVRTERKEMPKFTAFYTFNIRVKDSVAYLSGIVRAPENGFVLNDVAIEPVLTKEGKIKEKSIMGYAFARLNELALLIGKDIKYTKN